MRKNLSAVALLLGGLVTLLLIHAAWSAEPVRITNALLR